MRTRQQLDKDVNIVVQKPLNACANIARFVSSWTFQFRALLVRSMYLLLIIKVK